jgi:hypothetical protein
MRSERKLSRTTNHGYGESVMCNLTITSPVLRDGLLKQGITERKTDTCKFPEIPEAYMRHFMRGYVDGDGSFGLYHHGGRGRYNLSICASPEFAEGMRKVFSVVSNAPSGIYKRRKESKSRVISLRYSGKAVCDLLHYLYKGATIYLERKRDNYLRIVHNKNGCKEPVTSELQA